MIRNIVTDDITDPSANRGDIIIGMNTQLKQASAIGQPFVADVAAAHPLKLGSVLSFDFDGERQLHMLICHQLRKGGWADADRYIRFCLDYLWQQHGNRAFSIVQIGTGPVGKRDGADAMAIRTAIANSFLTVDLFVLPPRIKDHMAVTRPPLVPFRMWDMEGGEREIPALHAVAAA